MFVRPPLLKLVRDVHNASLKKMGNEIVTEVTTTSEGALSVHCLKRGAHDLCGFTSSFPPRCINFASDLHDFQDCYPEGAAILNVCVQWSGCCMGEKGSKDEHLLSTSV